MRLPVDPKDLMRSGSQLAEERERPVRIAVFVEIDTPEELVSTIQGRFRPYTANAVLHIEVAEPGTKLIVDPSADAVVCLIGSAGASIADSLSEARERAVPAVALVIAEVSTGAAEALGHPYRDTLSNPDAAHLVDIELGEWLVERLPAKHLALAHNYEFMRRAVAVERVKNTAFQNALIGAIAIIPGADLPLMTANQSKMLLQIAAAYGEQLGAQRWKELASVVGGAFVLRAVARQAVAFLPGFGWAIKGGIGYTGTIGMGFAAIKYFENDADLGDLQSRLEEYGRQAMTRVRSMSPRERKAALPAEQQAALGAPVAVPAEESPAGDA